MLSREKEEKSLLPGMMDRHIWRRWIPGDTQTQTAARAEEGALYPGHVLT